MHYFNFNCIQGFFLYLSHLNVQYNILINFKYNKYNAINDIIQSVNKSGIFKIN